MRSHTRTILIIAAVIAAIPLATGAYAVSPGGQLKSVVNAPVLLSDPMATTTPERYLGSPEGIVRELLPTGTYSTVSTDPRGDAAEPECPGYEACVANWVGPNAVLCKWTAESKWFTPFAAGRYSEADFVWGACLAIGAKETAGVISPIFRPAVRASNSVTAVFPPGSGVGNVDGRWTSELSIAWRTGTDFTYDPTEVDVWTPIIRDVSTNGSICPSKTVNMVVFADCIWSVSSPDLVFTTSELEKPADANGYALRARIVDIDDGSVMTAPLILYRDNTL